MIVAVNDFAYVAAALFVPLFGFLGLWLDARRKDRRIAELHEQVQSPNGQTTAIAVYETGKRVLEIREQMVEIREAQLAGWARAATDMEQAEADRARLEQKVDGIAAAQVDHAERDDTRFGIVFDHLGLEHPT